MTASKQNGFSHGGSRHTVFYFFVQYRGGGGNACRLKMYSLHRAWGSKKIILIIVHEMKCAKEAFEFPELLEGHI